MTLPPLPDVCYLGDDVSYGYDAHDMRDYATAAVKAALAQQRQPGPLNDDADFLVAGMNLPERYNSLLGHELFSPQQMRDYATAAAEAARAEERERCAAQLDRLGCDHCAAAIRARGE